MPPVRALLESDRFVPLCLLAALVLRLVAVALFPVAPVSDFEWYYGRAADIAAGHGLTFNGAPTAYWPPGYPFVLAAIFFVTGPSVLAAQLVNVALAIASLFLAYRLALRLSGSRLAAGITLAILAFYPNQIVYVALVANESLTTFLLLAGIALMLRANDGDGRLGLFVAAGLVFGLACLTKPQTVIIPTAILAWMAWRAWRARPTYRTFALRFIAVNAALAVVILPWTARNYEVFGHPVFIANSGGVNLYFGNNPHANGAYPPPDVATKLAVDMRVGGGSEYDIDRRAGRLAVTYAVQHPLQVILLVPKKIWSLYGKDADGFSWLEESEHSIGKLTPWKVFAQLYYLGLGALFIAALVWPRRGANRPDNLPLVIIVVFTAIYCIYFGQSRFHYPLMPWIAIYSGSFVAGLVREKVLAAERTDAEMAAPA